MTGNDATQRNSRDWIAAAFKQHEQSLLRYCCLLTDRTSAEEIVQETFARLCLEDEIDDASHLKRWLYKVSRNQAIDNNRRNGRMTVSALQENAVDPRQVEPVDQLADSEAASEIMRRVAALPKKQQEIVRLRFQAGLSYKEIAEVINSNVSNVGALLHEAIQTLRKRT